MASWTLSPRRLTSHCARKRCLLVLDNVEDDTPAQLTSAGCSTRFRWKAQNKSVLMFAGEAYNVEMGVTNDLFTDERDHSTASCLFYATPEDSTNFPATGASRAMSMNNPETGILSDIEAFANFIRFLAPAVPSSTGIPNNPSAASLANGQASFLNVGCALCHTPMLQTGSSSFSAGLNKVTAGLYSELGRASHGDWPGRQRASRNGRWGRVSVRASLGIGSAAFLPA
jgi:CxxC motif-containing protein (DUF1111 family)